MPHRLAATRLEIGLFLSHTHSAHPQYRPDIDGLRAFAVLVVVAFHAYTHGVNYRSGVLPIQRPNHADALGKALQTTVDRFSKIGAPVYYVTGNPEIGVDPRTCVPRPMQIGTPSCILERSAVEAWQAEYLSRVASLRGATVIRGTDLFCNVQTCMVVAQDTSLYRDPDHLSNFGSLIQAQAISRIIENGVTRD